MFCSFFSSKIDSIMPALPPVAPPPRGRRAPAAGARARCPCNPSESPNIRTLSALSQAWDRKQAHLRNVGGAGRGIWFDMVRWSCRDSSLTSGPACFQLSKFFSSPWPRRSPSASMRSKVKQGSPLALKTRPRVLMHAAAPDAPCRFSSRRRDGAQSSLSASANKAWGAPSKLDFPWELQRGAIDH